MLKAWQAGESHTPLFTPGGDAPERAAPKPVKSRPCALIGAYVLSISGGIGLQPNHLC